MTRRCSLENADIGDDVDDEIKITDSMSLLVHFNDRDQENLPSCLSLTVSNSTHHIGKCDAILRTFARAQYVTEEIIKY